MKKSCLFLLLLSSCAPYLVHQPNLLSPEDDKYSQSLNSCRHEVFAKNGPNWGQGLAGGGAGAVGLVAYGHNPAFDEVDDCLRKKGYKIAQ